MARASHFEKKEGVEDDHGERFEIFLWSKFYGNMAAYTDAVKSGAVVERTDGQGNKWCVVKSFTASKVKGTENVEGISGEHTPTRSCRFTKTITSRSHLHASVVLYI